MNLAESSPPPAAEPLRILQLEDSVDDAELELAQLRRDRLVFSSRRVDTREAFVAALEEFRPQIVIADYKLPAFDGGSALALVLERHPQIPVIMVSGALGDEGAVELLRKGARDFVLKDRMGRLGAAVRNVLAEGEERARRQRAEQALQDSERRFRNLIGSASDIVAIARADGTLEYVNPATRESLGYAPDELIGRNYFDLAVHNDPTTSRANLAQLVSHPGESMRFEVRLLHKDGSARHMETVARYVNDPLGTGGVIVNMRDVTWRRHAEERLRLASLLIEQSPSVLFRWSTAEGWPVVYASDNVRQWGYAPDELVSGRPAYAELVHPDDLARVVAELAAYAAGDATQFAQEYRIVKRSGEVIWVDDRSTIERDPAGKPVYFQGVVMDITARREAEIERQARLDRAQIQLAAVGQATGSPALAAGEVETLARELTELAARVSGAERANAWLFNDDETELHCIDLYEAGPARHSSGMVLKQSEFENEFRALKAAPFVDADDALSDPRTAGYVETYVKPLRITSMLDTVVEVGGRHLGLLCIEHVDRAHHWERDEIVFAGQLADRLGLCLLNRSRRELTAELQEAQRMSLMGNWRLDAATGKVTWSEELYRIFGLDPARPAPSFAEPILTPDSDLRLRECIRAALASGTPYCEDVSLVHPQLGLRWITARGEVQRDSAGTIVALRGTVQDITERKRQESTLQRTARTLKALSRGNSALVHAQDEQQLYEAMCGAIVEAGGYKLAWVGRPENDIARAVTPLAMAGDGAEYVRQVSVSWADAERGRGPVGRCIRLGEIQLVHDIASDPAMKPWHELASRHGYRSVIAMPLVSASGVFGSLAIYASEPDAFDFDEIALLTEMAGDLVYGVISLRAREAERLADEQVRALARFPAETPNAVMRIDRDGRLIYANPASAAFLSDCNARLDETVPEPCRSISAEALQTGRIKEEEVAFGEHLFALTFAPVAEAGYVNVYGVDVTARRQAELKLSDALAATVESIAATMEMRDPYTAGHQRRVANLAAAIAAEMGLPAATVEGIHFGALIHDLGKIQVPAEILAKPGHLSSLEMQLIMTHPQSGYDIIKNIRFPWPVAQMVLEHHERVDGSGYPQGLKGDQICLEARILAVADVVEAMSSHRPYRPGMGIDLALKEIDERKGVWLDAAAVDACLRLFREKRFTLESS